MYYNENAKLPIIVNGVVTAIDVSVNSAGKPFSTLGRGIAGAEVLFFVGEICSFGSTSHKGG